MSSDDSSKRGAEKDDAKKPPKPNTYYAGNGQAVEGDDDDAKEVPPTGSGAVNQLFDKAREHGAVPPEEFVSHRTQAFSGAGRRLGHDQGASIPVQPLSREERTVKITFYADGFTVDEDPELITPESPEGKAFLETLNNGMVPASIASRFPNTDIVVSLVDKSSEKYVRQFKAFAGGGQRLTAEKSGPKPAGNQAAEAPTKPFELNEDEVVGKVVLQMVDGTRHELKVNGERHTVADLRGVVASKAHCSPSDFDLVVRDVRPRPLNDPLVTLQAAKCVGCVVMVKAR